MTLIEQIIEESALELGLTRSIVKEAMQAQAQFTEEMIRSGSFEGVIWPNFGKFKVKKEKVFQAHNSSGARQIRKNTDYIKRHD